MTTYEKKRSCLFICSVMRLSLLILVIWGHLEASTRALLCTMIITQVTHNLYKVCDCAHWNGLPSFVYYWKKEDPNSRIIWFVFFFCLFAAKSANPLSDLHSLGVVMLQLLMKRNLPDNLRAHVAEYINPRILLHTNIGTDSKSKRAVARLISLALDCTNTKLA